MKIENQCCTLDQAKQLNAFGIRGHSYFCFIGEDTTDCPWKIYSTDCAYSEVGSGWYEERLNAYTVAELGMMLPDDTRYYRVPNGLYYVEAGFVDSGKTEAEARAALLIHFLKYKIIDLNEVNKSLAK